jgi:hypothetical protein
MTFNDFYEYALEKELIRDFDRERAEKLYNGFKAIADVGYFTTSQENQIKLIVLGFRAACGHNTCEQDALRIFFQLMCGIEAHTEPHHVSDRNQYGYQMCIDFVNSYKETHDGFPPDRLPRI